MLNILSYILPQWVNVENLWNYRHLFRKIVLFRKKETKLDFAIKKYTKNVVPNPRTYSKK